MADDRQAELFSLPMSRPLAYRTIRDRYSTPNTVIGKWYLSKFGAKNVWLWKRIETEREWKAGDDVIVSDKLC